MDSAAVVRPKFGESVSGDAAFVMQVDGIVLAAIVDVLGHGREANDLAVTIQQFLSRNATADIVSLLQALNEHIRGSRGAAVALCAVEPSAGRLRYTGIGNTVIRRFGATDVRLVSRDGVVGTNMRTPAEDTLQLAAGDIVVLYSDGVKTYFDPGEYPALRSDTPDAVAANILHRFGKPHDDASCVVLRYKR